MSGRWHPTGLCRGAGRSQAGNSGGTLGRTASGEGRPSHAPDIRDPRAPRKFLSSEARCGLKVWPTMSGGRASVAGKKECRLMANDPPGNDLYWPVPANDRACGLPELLSNTLYVAFSAPVMLGLK